MGSHRVTPVRLFLILNTALQDIPRLSLPPAAGDVVCYMRCAQNIVDTQPEITSEHGVETIFADTLINDEENRNLDTVGSDFLREWFRPNGKDFTDLGDISLGMAYSMELARQINPRVIIRFGEILRRLLGRYPTADTVVTDVNDGNGIFEVEDAYLPLRKVLGAVAATRNVNLIAVPAIHPIPPALKRGRHSNWLKTIKSLLGGLRPGWMTARVRLARQHRNARSQPVIYMILGRGQESIATRLSENGRVRVVVNRLDLPGTDAIRGEQLFALPRISDIVTVRSVLKQLTKYSEGVTTGGRFAANGIDYSPILFSAVRAVIASQIWSFLVVVAQSRRLHRLLKYNALFVAGAGAEFMGNLVALDQDSGRKVYLMPHGMDLQRFAYLMPGSDRQYITYLAYGSDHDDFYVSDGGPGQPIRTVVTGNPLTTKMLPLRDAPKSDYRQRLLILSFGHLQFWNADRIYAVDQYYTNLFAISRKLIAEGWQVGLRPHPYHPSNLERRIAKQFDIEMDIIWDTGETFEKALPQYDVAVCSASTTFYQSLFAGWPTIFYEPRYWQNETADLRDDPMMTGLVTAEDIARPVTSDPVELENLIRSSTEKESFVSAFPARFASELAPRFIGPCPETSDIFAVDFIEQDILEGTVGAACTSGTSQFKFR